MNKNLIITFDEDINDLILSDDFRNASLTDVSENPSPDTTYVFKMKTLFHEDKETVPFACNFNLPFEHCQHLTQHKLSKSKGIIRPKVTKSYTKDLDKPLQWERMRQLLDKWIRNLHKQYWMITRAEIYGEFTANGLIHAHGIVWIICAPAYAPGISALISKEWIRITKGSMASLAKTNAAGKFDFAFSKCNNVQNFLAYASKGPGLQALTPNMCDNKKNEN